MHELSDDDEDADCHKITFIVLASVITVIQTGYCRLSDVDTNRNEASVRKMYWPSAGAEVNHLLCRLRHLYLMMTGPQGTILVHCNLKQLNVVRQLSQSSMLGTDVGKAVRLGGAPETKRVILVNFVSVLSGHEWETWSSDTQECYGHPARPSSSYVPYNGRTALEAPVLVRVPLDHFDYQTCSMGSVNWIFTPSSLPIFHICCVAS